MEAGPPSVRPAVVGRSTHCVPVFSIPALRASFTQPVQLDVADPGALLGLTEKLEEGRPRAFFRGDIAQTGVVAFCV